MPHFFSRFFLYFNLVIIILIAGLSFVPAIYQPSPEPHDLAYYNGREIIFSARVCEESDRSYKNQRLTLCFFGQVSGWTVTGRVLVTTDLYPAYDYGDYLEVEGRLEDPPLIEGFDYRAYLARYGVASVMYQPRLSLVPGAPPLEFKEIAYRYLLDFKQALAVLIEKGLPEPGAGLAKALLLGYRRTIAEEDTVVFARVGLSHMIAISGSHITIMSAMIVNLLLAFGCSRRSSWRVVFVFLFAYPLMTGLSASAVRSAIMGTLAFLALYCGRSASLVRTLVMAAAVMLIFNPRLLRADVGFQLSFAALLGLIYLYPWFNERMERLFCLDRLRPRIRAFLRPLLETVNLTLVSQIAIMPIALWNFDQLSLIAPLANVLVLWTFPLLLSALIIALVLSAICPGLALLWFFPAYLLLRFIFLVSRLLAAPSWAAWEL